MCIYENRPYLSLPHLSIPNNNPKSKNHTRITRQNKPRYHKNSFSIFETMLVGLDNIPCVMKKPLGWAFHVSQTSQCAHHTRMTFVSPYQHTSYTNKAWSEEGVLEEVGIVISEEEEHHPQKRSSPRSEMTRKMTCLSLYPEAKNSICHNPNKCMHFKESNKTERTLENVYK